MKPGPRYLVSSTVLCNEAAKLLCCLVVHAWSCRGSAAAAGLPAAAALGAELRQIYMGALPMLLPATLFVVQQVRQPGPWGAGGPASIFAGVEAAAQGGAAGGTSRLGGVLWVLGVPPAAPTPEEASSGLLPPAELGRHLGALPYRPGGRAARRCSSSWLLRTWMRCHMR